MDLTPLITTFVIISMAELGDKTQLTVLSLCTKYKPKIIFLSSFLALILIGTLSIFIGSAITRFLPMFWIKIGSGLAFIIFGIVTLLEKDEGSFSCSEATFTASFSLVALMELGDKTQLATIVLATRFATPLLVFIGMGLAFLLITGAAVLLGMKLKDLLARRYIKLGSAVLFLSFGVASIIGAFTGISMF